MFGKRGVGCVAVWLLVAACEEKPIPVAPVPPELAARAAERERALAQEKQRLAEEQRARQEELAARARRRSLRPRCSPPNVKRRFAR